MPDDPLVDPLAETWNIHNRRNHLLLEAIPEDALHQAMAPKFRTIADLFAHIHNVRLMWLKPTGPDLLEGLSKLEKGKISKSDIDSALKASATAIAAVIAKSVAAGGKVSSFKPHGTAFVGYLISHESHHRGQIGWTMKALGKKLDEKTAYGLWDWSGR